MKKRESFFEGIILPTILSLKMLIPPFYSFKRLEQSCKTWLKRNPEASYPRSFLADLYRFYGKNEEAKQEYMELKHLSYMKDSDILGLSEVLFRLEDYQGVIETLALIIDKYSRHKNANWYLGISYMKKEDYQKAVVYLEKVISVGKKRYEDYWHLGFCYDRLGQFEKAHGAYYKALAMKDSKELRQNIASVHIRIAQSFLDADLNSAERELKKALDVYPGNAEAIRVLEGIQGIKGIDAIITEKEKELTANDSACTD